MEKLIEQIYFVLKEENETVESLLKLATQKTYVLSESNLEGLHEIIEQEQALKSVFDGIEKKRMNLSNEISMLANKHPILISEIIDMAQEPYQSELKRLQFQLQKNLFDYKQINELNTELIDSNLNYVDYMINAISRHQQQPVIYRANGYTQQEENKNRFIDNKA